MATERSQRDDTGRQATANLINDRIAEHNSARERALAARDAAQAEADRQDELIGELEVLLTNLGID